MCKNNYCYKNLSAKNFNKRVNAMVLLLENILGELLFAIICCSSLAGSLVLDVAVGITVVKIENTLLVVIVLIIRKCHSIT